MTVWPNGSTNTPTVTSEFGPRKAPLAGASTMHQGIDLVGFTYNCSPCDGVVIFARYNGGGGNEVRVRAANGDVFYMKHNASFLVKEGDPIREGARVGVQGRTGNVTGVHCHYECHPAGGAAVNPRIYMAAAIRNNTAGNPGVPIGNTPSPASGEEDDMYMTDDTDGTVWLVTANGFVALTHPSQIGLFSRLGVPRRDRFNRTEIDIMNGFILATKPAAPSVASIATGVWERIIAHPTKKTTASASDFLTATANEDTAILRSKDILTAVAKGGGGSTGGGITDEQVTSLASKITTGVVDGVKKLGLSITGVFK